MLLNITVGRFITILFVVNYDAIKSNIKKKILFINPYLCVYYSPASFAVVRVKSDSNKQYHGVRESLRA